MRITFSFLLSSLVACDAGGPDWLDDAEPVTLRGCADLGANTLPRADQVIWYDEGFGLVFEDQTVTSAEACWLYDAPTQTADLTLVAVVDDTPGIDTTLRVSALPMLEAHAQSGATQALTFVQGDDMLQTFDQDWTPYLRVPSND